MPDPASATTANRANHKWNFFRAGGFDQVHFESGADLLNLEHLDQKLWAALSCPTRGVEFDTKTLDLIDTDKDGRIRSPEILAAVKWACSMLKNPDELLRPHAALELSSISDATPEGKQVLASAKQILANLGKKDAAAISLEDTTDTVKIFAATQFNGDGIVPADSAGDDATKAVINDIIACLGSEPDRSGKPGISQARADQFFAEAVAFSDWWKKAETEAGTILPLGDTPKPRRRSRPSSPRWTITSPAAAWPPSTNARSRRLIGRSPSTSRSRRRTCRSPPLKSPVSLLPASKPTRHFLSRMG